MRVIKCAVIISRNSIFKKTMPKKKKIKKPLEQIIQERMVGTKRFHQKVKDSAKVYSRPAERKTERDRIEENSGNGDNE